MKKVILIMLVAVAAAACEKSEIPEVTAYKLGDRVVATEMQATSNPERPSIMPGDKGYILRIESVSPAAYHVRWFGGNDPQGGAPVPAAATIVSENQIKLEK